jgi:two-component system sensor histidine kinase KdpD
VLSDELVELRRLTAAAGTGLHTVLGEDVPEALLQFARDVGATQLVLGVDPGGALRPFRSGRVGAVVSAAAALDVHLVPVPALDRSRRSGRRRGPLSSRRRVLGWLAAVALPPIVSVIGVAAGDRADQCCSGVHVGRRRGGPDRGARCRWQHPLHGP